MFDCRSIYGNVHKYNMTFSEIWTRMIDFKNDYKESALYTAANKISDASIEALYYLLYADYGNNGIAGNDVNRFKYKVFSIIYQYGPNWEKELDIQSKLRALTDEDLQKGSTMIYNHSYNPSTAPSTATLEELTTINDQNTTKAKRSKLEGFDALVGMLDSDVTANFIRKFRNLFKIVVERDGPLFFGDDD